MHVLGVITILAKHKFFKGCFSSKVYFIKNKEEENASFECKPDTALVMRKLDTFMDDDHFLLIQFACLHPI